MNIQIQTISSCNAKCIFCPHAYSWFKNNNGRMSQELYNKIIRDLKDIKIDKICLYLMNEPLLDNTLFDKIESVKNNLKYHHIEISTNGFLLNNGIDDKLIKSLENTEHELWISFHGIDEKSYENNMNINFIESLKNIKNFLKKANYLNIIIDGAGAPYRDNIAIGFDKDIFIKFWNNIFDEINIEKRPRIRYSKYTDRAGNVKNTKKRLKELNNMKCLRIDNWLHVIYTGEVIFCCNDYFKEGILGDCNKETLLEIINGDKRKRIKKILKGEIESPDNFICKRCDSYAIKEIS